MKPAERLLGAAGALLPHHLLLKSSGVKLVLPYHHVVSDEALPHIQSLYAYKNVKQFTSDLDWLLRRYQPLHPDDLADAALNGKPLPRKRFLLSFDDGFRELHDVVAPLLLRKGVPALFFINPDFIDNKELFYRCKLGLVLTKAAKDKTVLKALAQYLKTNHVFSHIRSHALAIHYPQKEESGTLGRIAGIDFGQFLKDQRPFLTTPQLKALSGQGFRFGGHSMDHPSYSFLSLEDQYRQTVGSVAFAQNFNPGGQRFFAFPHLDKPVSQAFFERMKTDEPILFFGLQNQRDEEANRMYHRLNAENPESSVAARLRTVLLYNSLLRLAGRRTVIRK